MQSAVPDLEITPFENPTKPDPDYILQRQPYFALPVGKAWGSPSCVKCVTSWGH